MNKKEKAEEKIKKAIKELGEVLITKDIQVLSVSSSSQIKEFIDLFDCTLKKIASHNIPPQSERLLGIARIVVDQWPFELALGNIIIEAEEAYKAI